MIKFFRKIRHRLLSEGRTGKYFKYAIGEILLVVFGILIALGINNWNEQKRLKKEYISDLKAIKGNLEKDALNLSTNIKNGSRYAKEFQEQLNTDSFIIEGSSILMQISQPGLFFDDSSYKNAKNKNTLSFIQNDSLKNIFHEYYVRQIEIVQQSAGRLENIATILKTHYLESGLQKEEVSKNDIMNKLMQQGPFIDYLNFYIKERDEVINELHTIKDVNTLLSETIDIELKKIE